MFLRGLLVGLVMVFGSVSTFAGMTNVTIAGTLGFSAVLLLVVLFGLAIFFIARNWKNFKNKNFKIGSIIFIATLGCGAIAMLGVTLYTLFKLNASGAEMLNIGTSYYETSLMPMRGSQEVVVTNEIRVLIPKGYLTNPQKVSFHKYRGRIKWIHKGDQILKTFAVSFGGKDIVINKPIKVEVNLGDNGLTNLDAGFWNKKENVWEHIPIRNGHGGRYYIYLNKSGVYTIVSRARGVGSNEIEFKATKNFDITLPQKISISSTLFDAKLVQRFIANSNQKSTQKTIRQLLLAYTGLLVERATYSYQRAGYRLPHTRNRRRVMFIQKRDELYWNKNSWINNRNDIIIELKYCTTLTELKQQIGEGLFQLHEGGAISNDELCNKFVRWPALFNIMAGYAGSKIAWLEMGGGRRPQWTVLGVGLSGIPELWQDWSIMSLPNNGKQAFKTMDSRGIICGQTRKMPETVLTDWFNKGGDARRFLKTKYNNVFRGRPDYQNDLWSVY